MQLLLFFFLSFLAFTLSQPAQDKITSLPDVTGSLGTQYSGYFNVSNNGRFLHYIHVEALNNPETAPLVLWLNGGPGCSSLDGYFYEQGPFHFQKTQPSLTAFFRGGAQNVGADYSLVDNSFTWAKLANLIFLEAPAGVGFSYYTDPSDANVDDKRTAQDNYNFLLAFFQAYPHFKGRDFWITGESYAGIYVPTLANLVMQADGSGTFPGNFKGILVGNGVTDKDYDFDPLVSLFPFAYGHGLMSSVTWNEIQTACVSDPNGAKCQQAQGKVKQNFADIDIYDIYADCYHQRPNTPGMFFGSKLFGNGGDGIVPPCSDAKYATEYLNRDDVKSALHVKNSITWAICTEKINYNANTNSVIPIWRALMNAGYRVLKYSGDVDGAVPYTGTEAWINSMNLTVTGERWREWRFQDDEGEQVGGYITEFKEGLTFITVKGSGHMVPQYKPGPALTMFDKFINNKPF